jgi:hypothetical protein
MSCEEWTVEDDEDMIRLRLFQQVEELTLLNLNRKMDAFMARVGPAPQPLDFEVWRAIRGKRLALVVSLQQRYSRDRL